jgi:hypothetical protein
MATFFERKQENAVIDELDRMMDQRKHVTLARRKMLTMLGVAGAGAGIAALTGCDGNGTPALPTITPSVVDVLNFALNLEYLEASFYLYVSSGTGLSSADMGTGAGTVTGAPSKVTFTSSLSGVISSAAQQLALDEKEHVEFLRTTITAVGGTPVSMPNINLSANGAVTNDATFLAAARQFENVGVSAYGGGAQFLVSSTAALTYAAQILDTEGQHAGLVRQLCIALGVTSAAVDSQDNPPTSAKYFDTSSSTGLSPIRTPSQVMQILYSAPGQTGVSKGGFFPNGLNGSISTT